jgi:3-hydroxyacyl-CoA dehydrogenase
MVSPTLPVAVIGSGLIGTSWAALFAHVGGHDVRIWDPSPATCAAAPERIAAARTQLEALQPLRPGRVEIVSTLDEACAGCGWVQENAPEDLQAKRELYKKIEAAVAPDTIIASSTSALLWSQLADGMTAPSRFVTAHPFNPPHLMPLVEIFGTDPAVLGRAVAFFEAMERVPVVLKREAPGHIAGRLSAALWREAVALVAEGVASVADVDRALVHGPGLRWSVVGAHMGYHLGGGDGGIGHYLRTLGPSQERRWATLGTPSLSPEVQAQLVAGIEGAAAGRSVAALSDARDEALIDVLTTLGKHRP